MHPLSREKGARQVYLKIYLSEKTHWHRLNGGVRVALSGSWVIVETYH